MIHVLESHLDGRLMEQVEYDTDALTVTFVRDGVRGDPRPMTADEEVGAAYVAFDAVRVGNRAQLVDPVALQQRRAALNAYQTDETVAAYLAAPNTTALTVAQQNAVNKALIRHVHRLTRLVIALTCLGSDPSLLDNIADTAGT